ncbi:MAG: NUDIX hydrolase [Candidatus Paceibacterota bacterium]|jgi:mutator protein MutT
MFNKPQESKTFINLGVVLNDKGEVLIIRRKVIEKGADGSILQWAFSGGKQQFNETREECVEREVLAETGYDVESIKQISIRVHPQFPVTIVYHLCSLKASEPIDKPNEPHEIAEIKWIKPEEIKEIFTTDIDPKVANELGI